jgi:hypothetical protein
LLPDLVALRKAVNRGSLAELSFSCPPHTVATMGEDSPWGKN